MTIFILENCPLAWEKDPSVLAFFKRQWSSRNLVFISPSYLGKSWCHGSPIFLTLCISTGRRTFSSNFNSFICNLQIVEYYSCLIMLFSSVPSWSLGSYLILTLEYHVVYPCFCRQKLCQCVQKRGQFPADIAQPAMSPLIWTYRNLFCQNFQICAMKWYFASSPLKREASIIA